MIAIQFRALLAAAVITCAPTKVSATLWASSSGGGAVGLSEVNPATGAASPLFFISSGLGSGVDDLAGDAQWQGTKLWGVRNAFSTSYIASWNPYNKQLLSELPINTPTQVRTLAIDPLTGDFYTTTTAALYKLAPTTGQATLIGPTDGIDKALGFDAQGNLYGVGNQNVLYSIDKSSGLRVQIAVMNVSRMEDITYRPSDGAMLGIGFGNYSLFRIDLNTGATTNLGSSLSRPSGLAFVAAPEPSGLVTLAGIALTLICLQIRTVRS